MLVIELLTHWSPNSTLQSRSFLNFSMFGGKHPYGSMTLSSTDTKQSDTLNDMSTSDRAELVEFAQSGPRDCSRGVAWLICETFDTVWVFRRQTNRLKTRLSVWVWCRDKKLKANLVFDAQSDSRNGVGVNVLLFMVTWKLLLLFIWRGVMAADGSSLLWWLLSAHWLTSGTTMERRRHALFFSFRSTQLTSHGFSDSSGWIWFPQSSCSWTSRAEARDDGGMCEEAVNGWPGSAGLLSGCVWAVLDLWTGITWHTYAETTGRALPVKSLQTKCGEI